MTDQPFDRVTVDALRARGGLKWAHDTTVIPAWVAEMDFGTAPAIVEALHAGVDAMTFGYLSGAMAADMSQACSGWLQAQHGWDVPADRIYPVGDVLTVLELSLTSLLPPGATVILPTPAYMPFVTVPPLVGHQVVEVPGRRDGDGRWSLDLAALNEAFGRAGNALFVLCNPWNPVGTVLSREELEAVCELVEQHPQVRVFADEIHGALVYPGGRHVPYASISPEAAAHSLTATSASKAWNIPGLKAAQLILTSDEHLEKWAAVQFLATKGASNLGVLAATAAYTAGQPWLDGVVDYLDGSRRLLGDLVAAELPSVRYRPPEGTYLAWLDCTELGLPEAPAEFFRRAAGVALVDGSACGTAGAGSVRLNFATPRPVLADIVARMGAAVRSAQSRSMRAG